MKSSKILSTVIIASFLFTSTQTVFALDTNIKNTVAKAAANSEANIDYLKDTKNKSYISKDKARDIAVKLLNDNFEIDIKKSFTLESQFREKDEWIFIWNLEKVRKSGYISMAIDAYNGKLLSVHINEDVYNENDSNDIIKQKDAEKIAFDLINKIAPEESKQVKSHDSHVDFRGSMYYFGFIREIDGIEIVGNTINIGINKFSGKPEKFYYNWDDNLVPISKEGILSSEEAKEKILNNINMHLIYNNGGYDFINKNSIKLIYRHQYKNGYYMDAKTGEMIDAIDSPPKAKVLNLTNKEKNELYKKALASKKIQS